MPAIFPCGPCKDVVQRMKDASACLEEPESDLILIYFITSSHIFVSFNLIHDFWGTLSPKCYLFFRKAHFFVFTAINRLLPYLEAVTFCTRRLSIMDDTASTLCPRKDLLICCSALLKICIFKTLWYFATQNT